MSEILTTPTTIMGLLARELEQEAKTTRKMLERVPAHQFDWQPHEKSMTMKRLVTHIAHLPSWVGMTLTTSELDFAKNPYQEEQITSQEELLNYFERMMDDGRHHFAHGSDDQLDEPWTLREGDQVFLTSSKYEVLRMTLSQIIHHRAQLGVYLRLLNIPIPASYGPSADEMGL
ncbi:DinB family protein [Rufibacter quisquiliarum]|uniref:Putative damage-inducible protein DinB n=1 Tax=Rufibacter quisquiliarum TaxID=1549639 RepID=A0A839GL31_9BACT|nr:DinB family protein [Rufibacter quisquiliarum]MBA9079390.1 putative damage-inducible protein DinB [Rufibacter quisquiliarum]